MAAGARCCKVAAFCCIRRSGRNQTARAPSRIRRVAPRSPPDSLARAEARGEVLATREARDEVLESREARVEVLVTRDGDVLDDD